MESIQLSQLQSNDFIRRIAEETGAVDAQLFAPALNFFPINITADFELKNQTTIALNYTKKTLFGEKTYGCQLQIAPEDERWLLTDPSRQTPPEDECNLQDFLDALVYLPQAEIEALVQSRPDMYSIDFSYKSMPDDAVPEDGQPCIYYDKNGVTEPGRWLIRLDILPMYRDAQNDGYAGAGEDRIHLFYVVPQP